MKDTSGSYWKNTLVNATHYEYYRMDSLPDELKLGNIEDLYRKWLTVLLKFGKTSFNLKIRTTYNNISVLQGNYSQARDLLLVNLGKIENSIIVKVSRPK